MRSLRTRWAILACAAIGLFGAAAASAAEQVSALRVMLHPNAAARGELPPDARATLEALSGTALTLTGTTRTGALELSLPAPVPEADAATMVKALRVDRSVLWAEPIRTPVLARKASAGDPRGGKPGRRLMVRLKDDVTPDWPSLLTQLGNLIGMKVTLERQIGNISVLSVPLEQGPELLAQLAEHGAA